MEWPSPETKEQALRAGWLLQERRVRDWRHDGIGSMNLCGFEVGLDRPLFLIAGPCVVESEQLQLDAAGTLKEITGRLGITEHDRVLPMTP